MAIFELPFATRVDRSSGPTTEGFSIDEIRYSGNISQRSFSGPSQEASRKEEWKITWKLLQYSTPTEVAAGAVDELGIALNFYKAAYLGKVRWRPFEFTASRIWEIVPNSLSRDNPAGSIFNVTFKLKLLYVE